MAPPHELDTAQRLELVRDFVGRHFVQCGMVADIALHVLARCGRATRRLETIVHHVGLVLGGRSSTAFADCAIIPVSNDSLRH